MGRDGCRVPIRWESEPPGSGFTEGTPWLLIPESWASVSVAAQQEDEGSMLALYRAALACRRGTEALRGGGFAWQESPPGSLVFARETADETVLCAVNVEAVALDLAEGELLLTSEAGTAHRLPPNSAAWVRLPQ